jgi:nucleoside-diphosphate-sugar epimerase
MHVVVLGATGHIGTFLIPRLIESGHSVTAVSRGKSKPYQNHPYWKRVHQLTLDRDALEAENKFGERIAQEKPDVVIDLICFTKKSAQQLCEALEGRVQHVISCGSIWVHGPSEVIPTTEDQPRNTIGDYGIGKANIEAYLLKKSREENFPATIIHPGHIVGPGWLPLNPQGHFNIEVWRAIKRGEPLVLPNLGLETVHHVHADDLAQLFMRCLERRSLSLGESFHGVSPKAVTLRGYASWAYRYFGQEPNIQFSPVEELRKTLSEEDAWFTMDHISRSPCCSIEKAQTLLTYHPRYSSFQAIDDALQAMIHQKLI